MKWVVLKGVVSFVYWYVYVRLDVGRRLWRYGARHASISLMSWASTTESAFVGEDMHKYLHILFIDDRVDGDCARYA
jgi:hypothetical protein